MLRLDSTLRKLQILLSGVITTSQLPVMVMYSDRTSTAYSGAAQLANTNSTTAVDICAAPAASTIRDIDYISVRNSDTVAATATIRYNDNATLYTIVTVTLAVGDQLVYVHGDGWRVVDASGYSKVTNIALTGGVTTVGNVATVVTNANLTGGVTSVGNAATVITNANLTGVVTSTGNATAIADTALSIAKTSGLQAALDGKQPLDAGLTALAAGSDFVQFTGPLTPTKVFTLPDASSTLLVSGGALGTPSSGVATNLTGTASGLTAGNVTTNANLTGDVTSVGNATTLTNAPVIAKVLTGYVSGAGTVAATDSILAAIQKLNGNDATNANLTGHVTSVGNAAVLGSFTLAQLNTAVSDADVVSIAGTETITGAKNFTANIGLNTASNLASSRLDVRGRIRVGSGDSSGDAELTFSNYATATSAWNISVRQDVAGANNDLKLLRFDSTGAYQGVALQVAQATGNVSIGGEVSANANAILDIISTTKAFMPPRMTTAQKAAIASPTAGMVVYDATLANIASYTTEWESVTSYGAAGAVGQLTSKATGVTLNTKSGTITMNGAALNLSTSVGFTFTNSKILAGSVVVVNIASVATANAYLVTVDALAAGSCRIQLRNESLGSLSEALVLNFKVL